MSAAPGLPGSEDPVEDYLDQLLVALPGPPRQVRRTLAEVEAHLLDAVAAGRSDGLDEVAARAQAVRRLGPVAGVTAGGRLTGAVRRRLVLATLLVAGVGGLAVGVGGVFGRVVQAVWGSSALAVPFPAGAYSQADCARWLAGYPSARTCVAAMTADHADDFLRNAFACAVLGLLALAGRALLQRRWAARTTAAGSRLPLAAGLPAGTEAAVGAALALLAAVGLAAQGVDAVLVTRGQGAGQPFSLAAAAVLAGLLLLRQARQPARRLLSPGR